MESTWLVIEGKAQIKKNEIVFDPIMGEGDIKGDSENYLASKIRSNLYFRSGTIEITVKLEGAKDKIQLLLGGEGDGAINVGLNGQTSAYGIAEYTKSGWQMLGSSGRNNQPPTGEWLKLRIDYLGSLLEFFVNDVKVAKSSVTIPYSQIDIVYMGMATATIKDFQVISRNPNAFVVMQFSEAYNSLYNEVIVPVCKEYDYDVVRADDMYTTGLIIEDITRAIQESSLVIADITPNNANVYYEVGYAHGIKKPTILLSDKNREKLPFDISGFRLLFYENSIAGKPNVESALRKHLEAIKKG